MKLRKGVKQLAEDTEKPIPFMTLLEKAQILAKRVALKEAAENGEFDSEDGFDELGDDDEPVDDDDDLDAGFDDDDFDAADDRETVTITIPVDATLEEITDAIAQAQVGAEDEALDAEATAAAEDAADDLEAGAAAEEAADAAGLDDEDDDDADFDAVEEDEEAFAATRTSGPVRKPASTSYTNKMTVDSNIRPVTSMGKPATIADGSPKRQPASGSYDNNMTIKSRIQKDTRWYQS